MNKILNWTIGSFFRTIGRIIAYLGIGIAIAYILNSSNFDWGGITELFFDRVDALSLDGTLETEVMIFNQNRVIEIHNYNNDVNNVGEYYQAFDFDYTNTNGYQYMVIPYALTTTQNYSTYGDVDGYSYDVFISMVLRITLTTSGGAWAPCEIQNNMIVCKLNQGTNYNGIIIDYVDPINPNNSVVWNYIYLHNYVQLWNTSERNITNAIDSQTQQQQQNHEETQNYLEDTNTTQANTEGQDFINNFSNDTHGLTGIITAPLNAIQSLVGSTCSNLVLPLPFVNNKSLTLPCMSTIYSEHFGVFYTMYQGIILALISYWVCVRLFTLVKGFKDPEDDKIEVMDL